MKENASEPDQVWWHIASDDGSYLSRARFGTKEAALGEMVSARKTYSPRSHHAVRVEYRFTETARDERRKEKGQEEGGEEEEGGE